MKKVLLSLVIAVSCLPLSAQQIYPVVDISLDTDSNAWLDVHIRPTLDFDETFSSSVFTIRWNAADGATLGNISQTIPMLITHSISKSGTEQDDNGFRYQIFAGFSLTQPLSNQGLGWTGGQEFYMMSIPVNGSSSFEIVNDAWTGANNGDFFISLNGYQTTNGPNPIPGPATTGMIYSSVISTGIDQELSTTGSLLVSPNPTDGLINIQVDAVDDGMVEVINGLGQIVLTESMAGNGELLQTMDISGMESGPYLVRYSGGSKVETTRIVLR